MNIIENQNQNLNINNKTRYALFYMFLLIMSFILSLVTNFLDHKDKENEFVLSGYQISLSVLIVNLFVFGLCLENKIYKINVILIILLAYIFLYYFLPTIIFIHYSRIVYTVNVLISSNINLIIGLIYLKRRRKDSKGTIIFLFKYAWLLLLILVSSVAYTIYRYYFLLYVNLYYVICSMLILDFLVNFNFKVNVYIAIYFTYAIWSTVIIEYWEKVELNYYFIFYELIFMFVSIIIVINLIEENNNENKYVRTAINDGDVENIENINEIVDNNNSNNLRFDKSFFFVFIIYSIYLATIFSNWYDLYKIENDEYLFQNNWKRFPAKKFSLFINALVFFVHLLLGLIDKFY